MSYDLVMFKAVPGEDPEEAALRDFSELPAFPPNPEAETLKRRIAEALISQNSHLEIFPFDFKVIAESQKISVEAARGRYRHIELNGPDDGNGI
jgi:hypothetical protein